MAKSKGTKTRGQRDAFVVSSPLLSPISADQIHQFALHERKYNNPFLRDNDNRYFRADRSVQPPQYTNKNATRLKAGVKPQSVKFSIPRQVATCVRRKIRKEVMFALKLRGKGSGSRRRKRNFWSRISC